MTRLTNPYPETPIRNSEGVFESNAEVVKLFSQSNHNSSKVLSDDYELMLQDKVIVHDNKECLFIEKSDIIYAEAEGAYTRIHLKEREEILISKNLKTLVSKLNDNRFIRPHKSYLVNCAYITKYIKGEGGYLVVNNKNIPVSARKKGLLFDLFDRFTV